MSFLSNACPVSDRTSKVARITELSQTIQSRLRGPMQELERHLECEHISFCSLYIRIFALSHLVHQIGAENAILSENTLPCELFAEKVD